MMNRAIIIIIPILVSLGCATASVSHANLKTKINQSILKSSNTPVHSRSDHYYTCGCVVKEGQKSCTCNKPGGYSIGEWATPQFSYHCTGKGMQIAPDDGSFAGAVNFHRTDSIITCAGWVINAITDSKYQQCTNWSVSHRHAVKWDGIRCLVCDPESDYVCNK